MERKYEGYDTLKMQLTRCKTTVFNKPGTIASVLLRCFYEQDGHLKAETIYQKGLCQEGEFKLWRRSLIKEGYLIYDEKRANESGIHTTKHYAGPKLAKIINKYYVENEQLITKKDIELIEKNINHRLENCEKLIKYLIEKFDPPYTENKMKKYLNEI